MSAGFHAETISRRESGLARDLRDDLGQLVDVLAARRRPGPPLHAVHRSQFAGGIRPLVPDRDSLLLQPPHIRLAAEEPQQLVGHRLEVHPLRGDQREPLRQVEPQLPPEDAGGARSRPVGLVRAVLEHVAQQILVGRRDGGRHPSHDTAGRRHGADRPGAEARNRGTRTSHCVRAACIQPQGVSLRCCDPDQRAFRPRRPAGVDGRRRRSRSRGARAGLGARSPTRSSSASRLGAPPLGETRDPAAVQHGDVRPLPRRAPHALRRRRRLRRRRPTSTSI